MKDSVKKFFEIILVIGSITLFIVLMMWDNGYFKNTPFDNIFNVIGIIISFGMMIFFATMLILGIYIYIRDSYREKVQREARRLIAREKYLEYMKNKEKENEED